MPGKLQLKTLLEQRYDRITFVREVLSSIFDGRLTAYSPALSQTDLTATEQKLLQAVDHYADLTLDDGTEVRCFEIRLQPKVRIEQSRVGIQLYVRKLLTAGQAVLVNFVPTLANGQPDPAQPWRLTLVAKDTALIDGEIKERPTHAKRYTYLLGPGQACRTAAERLVKLYEKTTLDFAALVQTFEVEALSKTFFKEYKRHYEAVNTYLNASVFRVSVFNSDEKAIRDWSKKLLGRVVFLYFVQKKGWLGASNTDYQDGNTRYAVNFMTDLFIQSGGNDAFYPNWLSPLFFETLNQPRPNDDFTMPDGSRVKVPFLNGGLFDRDAPDHKGPIPLPARLFHNDQNLDDPALRGFLDFLNSYNFTVHEDSPDDHYVAVDPEMLGNIFENLLEDNKDKGAFYTPKAIVHYMCQESLIEYLHTALNVPDHRANLADFVQTKLPNAFVLEHAAQIDGLLDAVKICDPAIGSGAFPMGLLQEIYQCKLALPGHHDHAEIKLNIIQNSIYGVDIERGAVDIARLRFWLSLVVDEERPRSLPNLDYKIVVGNSLVSKLDNEILTLDWTLRGNIGAEQEIVRLTKQLGQKQRAFFTASGDKTTAQRDIRDLKIDLLLAQISLDRAKLLAKMPGSGLFGLSAKEQKLQMELQQQLQAFDANVRKLKALRQDPAKPLPYFDWRLDFPEVLNPHVTEQVGFDIVIGNPPYVDIKGLPSDDVKLFFEIFQTTKNRINLYAVFLEKSYYLLNKNAILTFIIPNSLLLNESYVLSRRLIVNDVSVIVKLPDAIFEHAIVETIILQIQKNCHSSEVLGVYFRNDDKPSLERLLFKPFLRKNWINDAQFKFNIFQSTSNNEVIAKIKNAGQPLVELVDFSLGITPYDKYRGHSEDVIRNKAFHSTIKLDATYVPLISGSNISKYYINPVVSEYLRYSNWLGAARERRFFTQPRIIVRQITATNPLSILAGYTEDELYFTQIGFALIKKTLGLDLKYLTALLNCTLLNFYHNSVYLDIEKKVFQKVLIANCKQLPIRVVNDLLQEPIVTLVTQILDAKRANPAADTSALEAEIDLRVYHLYNLTHAEVLLIDPQFALSEAEYVAAGEKMAVS